MTNWLPPTPEKNIQLLGEMPHYYEMYRHWPVKEEHKRFSVPCTDEDCPFCLGRESMYHISTAGIQYIWFRTKLAWVDGRVEWIRAWVSGHIQLPQERGHEDR